MDERNAKDQLDLTMPESPEEGDATDIVGRTGEEMPLAMHDQGHRAFRAAAPQRAFDPRLADDES